MTATLVVNADMGNYSSALGSAEMLPNGNLAFESGFSEQTIEVRPNGTKTYELKMNMTGVQYRSYIYPGAYGIPASTLYSRRSTPIPRPLALRLKVLERRASLQQLHPQRQASTAVSLRRSLPAASRVSHDLGLLDRRRRR